MGDKAQELEDKERGMPLPLHRVVMAGVVGDRHSWMSALANRGLDASMQ